MEHTVTIQWGVSMGDTHTYRFDTREELNAFMEGVEAAEGWMSKVVIEDSRDHQDPEEPLIIGG